MEVQRITRKGYFLTRIFKIGTLGLLIAALLLYLGDVVVFQIRTRNGSAYGSIEVNQFLKTPLKGQKEEYDVVGTTSVTCSRSIFPQNGASACWWLERHRTQWQ